MKDLRVLQWNSDSIGNKRAELEEVTIRRNVDVAIVQESKLGAKSKTPVFDGYIVVGIDCMEEKGWTEGEVVYIPS